MALLSRTQVENPAIAFDVDETLIMWHPTDNDLIITRPIVHQLFNHAAHLGYKIFIITARMSTKDGLEYMTKQLKATGYNLSNVPAQGMYMTPKEFTKDDHPGKFKSFARDHLQKKFGVNLVAMVGDKWWDCLVDGESPDDFLDPTDCHIVVNPDSNALYGVKLNLEDKESTAGHVVRHGDDIDGSILSMQSMSPPPNTVI